MLDRALVSKQIDRLRGLSYFPRDEAPLHELLLAAEASYNEFILAYVVDEWLKYETEAPKPAQIRGMIWEENHKLENSREEERQEKLSRRGANCPFCHDFGIVESIRGAPVESVASYCHCVAGRRREARVGISKEEPGWDEWSVLIVNESRQKLLRLGGSKAALRGMLKRTERSTPFGRSEGVEV